jgi:hypothetical protein
MAVGRLQRERAVERGARRLELPALMLARPSIDSRRASPSAAATRVR